MESKWYWQSYESFEFLTKLRLSFPMDMSKGEEVNAILLQRELINQLYHKQKRN